MPKAKVAGRHPAKELLDAGEYYWCACGRSKSQPFCDGSHAGTEINPIAFKVEKADDAFLCLCKQTGNSPFCDGTHKSIPDEVEDMEYPPAASSGMPQPKNTAEEPTVEFIHALARDGLEKTGHHGPVAAMGVPRNLLPT